MPILRIPYTDPLPLPKIIPATAHSRSGAIAALVDFLSASQSRTSPSPPSSSTSPWTQSPNASSSNASAPIRKGTTLLLTGAGISVASGLADYRGTNGTYTLNRKYKPIYFHEFCESHEARKRYWARSFLGWTNMERAKPNAAHRAVGKLGELGVVGGVVTQNVDSFHPLAHPSLPTIELHGYLRSLICLTCSSTYPRSTFQTQLSRLNPAWAAFLQEIIATGALDTENPHERRKKGLKTNPDGDVDIPDAPYTTFRYPACPVCLEKGAAAGGTKPSPRVEVDRDGAWKPSSTAGILKPAVVMFGESIPTATKSAAEAAVDAAERILVVGSSLATYSAWRLVKRAKERDMPIGVLNVGGVRGEDSLFDGVYDGNTAREAVRVAEDIEAVLPEVARMLEGKRGE